MDNERESFSGEETGNEPASGEMNTPAEAMQDSESDFEETVEESGRPMGSGARTPASPPNS
jgi:hypothetical protein